MDDADQMALCAVENKLLSLELKVEKLKGYLDEVVNALTAEFGKIGGH